MYPPQTLALAALHLSYRLEGMDMTLLRADSLLKQIHCSIEEILGFYLLTLECLIEFTSVIAKSSTSDAGKVLYVRLIEKYVAEKAQLTMKKKTKPVVPKKIPISSSKSLNPTNQRDHRSDYRNDHHNRDFDRDRVRNRDFDRDPDRDYERERNRDYERDRDSKRYKTK